MKTDDVFRRLSETLGDVENFFVACGVRGESRDAGKDNHIWSYAGAYLTPRLKLRWDAIFWKDAEDRENGLLDVRLLMRLLNIPGEEKAAEKMLPLVSMQYLMDSKCWAVSFGSRRTNTARWFRKHFEERPASNKEAVNLLRAIAEVLILDQNTP